MKAFLSVFFALLISFQIPFQLQAAMDYGKQSLIGSDFSQSDLKGATFYLTNLQDADLSGSDLQGANLFGAKLLSADLSNANLFSAKLPGSTLNNCNLTDVNFRESDLIDSLLKAMITQQWKT